ncbi:putative membrane protein [Proteus mirabilis HI4320]|uniref:Membrane protein n=1 Tax=Proteus mirabilis (strain HI4320) TaxID=529507 RepID=B4F0L4_PROMH|nr:putative membrane protein [Proteus mirabilis HI4320]
MINYLILFYLLVSVTLFIYRTIKSKKSYHDKYSLGEAIDYSTLWPLYIFIGLYFFISEKYRKFIGMSEER